MIIAILQAILLLDGGGVGPMHPVVRLPQPIDSPVPVRGRFHHQALDIGVIRGSLLQDRRESIGSAFLVDDLVLLIH
jgi:hypothetical protein